MASGHYGELQNKFICPRFYSHKDYVVVVVVNVELKLIHLPFKYYNRLITFSSIKKNRKHYYRLNDWQIIITLITEERVPFYKIIIRNFGILDIFQHFFSYIKYESIHAWMNVNVKIEFWHVMMCICHVCCCCCCWIIPTKNWFCFWKICFRVKILQVCCLPLHIWYSGGFFSSSVRISWRVFFWLVFFLCLVRP